MKTEIVAVGASAGGVEALKIVLQGFRKPSRLSVLVVLHMPGDGPNLLPTLYRDVCQFEVKEAESGEPLAPEMIYIAPPGYHLSAEADKTVSLSSEAAVNFSRPSIDVLMDSVAVSFGERGCGVLLTGANHDGAAGMLRLHKRRGLTIIQDPEEAEFRAMPESCLELFLPDLVLRLEDIAKKLTHLSGGSNG